jgi:hypothetical protein
MRSLWMHLVLNENPAVWWGFFLGQAAVSRFAWAGRKKVLGRCPVAVYK